MNLRYQLILILLTPVFIWLTLKHYFQHKDSRYLWQRIFALKLPSSNHNTWFHCASVGEVMTLIPLINAYHKKHPDHRFLVTTATITGARTCENKLPSVTHSYLPLDYRGNIKRFINKMNPECLIIMETEIWPNLYKVSSNNFVPITIINGRLSSRTTDSKSWFKRIFFGALQHVDHIYCRSEEDANAFQKLGAKNSQVEVIGNLKFSTRFSSTVTVNMINRPYVVAASTRDHEEKKIVELWNKAEHGDLLLVIVPRHPERKEKIIDDLKCFNETIKIRSLNQPITDDTSIYLADTMGELPTLFQHAEFVIMGGSFVKKGGHNILEPANFSRAILFGPSMENFEAESRLFLQQKAALQARNDEVAVNYINQLITDKNSRETLGKNAHVLIMQHRDIAERYLHKLTE